MSEIEFTHGDRTRALERFVTGKIEEGDFQILEIICQELLDADIVDRIPQLAHAQEEALEEFEGEIAERIVQALGNTDSLVRSYFLKLLKAHGLPTELRPARDSTVDRPSDESKPTSDPEPGEEIPF
jgi:hypothetical protein